MLLPIEVAAINSGLPSDLVLSWIQVSKPNRLIACFRCFFGYQDPGDHSIVTWGNLAIRRRLR